MEKRQEHGHGLKGLDRHAWVTLAEERVYELVDRGLAVPQVEIEARLWDTGWPNPAGNGRIRFFPHILSEAINNLAATDTIKVVSHPTKGGVAADLYIPSSTRLRTTAIADATRRKAMMYARFLRCSTTFGPAGEAVVRSSLDQAMRTGFLPITPTPAFGEVREVGAVKVPGALDSGAWVLVKDAVTAIPRPYALLIEVKNRRLTLYPRHGEVHQLLAKAAYIQQQLPDLPIVPLLVCRRGHDRLFWMAKDLGFLVHAAKAQFFTLPPKTTERHVEEMRTELGLSDLKMVTPDSSPRIIELFTSTIPSQAAATAARWASVGSLLLSHFETLRPDTITPTARNAALAALRTEAGQILAGAGVKSPILAWALEDEEDVL